jgi:hypothetical protein
VRIIWARRRLEALSRATVFTKWTEKCSPGLACSAWGGVGTIVDSGPLVLSLRRNTDGFSLYFLRMGLRTAITLAHELVSSYIRIAGFIQRCNK